MPAFPKVSVVVPCYNAEPFLEAALKSAYLQDWPALEVIVVDDGSSDKSVQLVRTKFPGTRLIQQRNRGAASARNTGIEAATGEYVAFLDGDDYWLPGKLRAQWESLRVARAALMSYTAWAVWSSSESHPGAALLAELEASSTSSKWAGPSGWIYTDLLLDAEVWTSTVMVHRSVFDDIGLFDVDLPIGEDYDFWLRASRATEILRIARPFALYRMHPTSITKTAPSRNFQALVVSRALEKWGYDCPSGATADPRKVKRNLARSWLNFANTHLTARNFTTARDAAVKSLQLQPHDIRTWKVLASSLMRAFFQRDTL